MNFNFFLTYFKLQNLKQSTNSAYKILPSDTNYYIVFYHNKFVHYFLLKKGFQMDFNSPLVQSRKYSFCDDAIMHHRGLSE